VLTESRLLRFGLAALTACFGLAALTACSTREPPVDVATAPAPSASAPNAAATPPAKGPRHDAIVDKLLALRDRQACNRVTGCPGLVELFQYGPELIAPATEALFLPNRGDGHWTIALPELLGQLGDASAAEPLVRLLADRRWEIRIAAAVGLAHLGPKAGAAAKSELERLAALPDNDPTAGGDLAFRAALELALMRIDEASTKVHRAALLALIPQRRETVLGTPAPILDVLVSLVGHARLSEALPGVREALGTGNRFVVVSALDVAGRLQDSGAIVPILPLLEDANPTIRRTAFAALTKITGASFDTAEQWREWARRQQLLP